jgi:hypothetical protein
MSDAVTGDIEGLLRQALRPVEPPADLAARLETTLTSLTELAAEELEAWELSAMRDPRNWARPAAAAAVGAAAGTGLVVLRARARGRRRSRAGAAAAGRVLLAAADELRRLGPR